MCCEWSSIESAPRDGTWFLACRADEGFESYEIGCYDPLKFPRYEPVEGGLYRRVDEEGYEWRGFNNMHRMTHWRALPPPPARAAAEPTKE